MIVNFVQAVLNSAIDYAQAIGAAVVGFVL